MKRVIETPALQNILEDLPISAGLYWQLRNQLIPPKETPYWHRFQRHLPVWVAETRRLLEANTHRHDVAPRRIALFASQRYWIEYSSLLGLALAGLGHQISLAYVPFIHWQTSVNRFEHHRQQVRINEVLEPLEALMNLISFADTHPKEKKNNCADLPARLVQALEEISVRDVQYTLQVEEVDRQSDLYQLRFERNSQAACAGMRWMQANRPDLVITPNGSILEMGAIYEVARYLEIPAVTYEFGEQRGRIWLAQNAEVMRQNTDTLWAESHDKPLSNAQWEQIRALYASRERASLWENFARLWQEQPVRGGERVRLELGLDERPVFLLPANVIGDSLTLGRQVFSQSMTEWLERTIKYFAGHPEVQLIVRIHPGERYLKGPSVADVARKVLPNLGSDPSTSHIRLLKADTPVNTYDLVEIADLGMVYTTTVGMEMAMSGVPVVVGGDTHYRGKGFTLDPNTWDDYFDQLDQAIQRPGMIGLERRQVEQAWNYAYRFFFQFPLPFPWHLSNYVETSQEWPISRTLSEEGWEIYGSAFRCLAGEPRGWASEQQ